MGDDRLHRGHLGSTGQGGKLECPTLRVHKRRLSPFDPDLSKVIENLCHPVGSGVCDHRKHSVRNSPLVETANRVFYQAAPAPMLVVERRRPIQAETHTDSQVAQVAQPRLAEQHAIGHHLEAKRLPVLFRQPTPGGDGLLIPGV